MRPSKGNLKQAHTEAHTIYSHASKQTKSTICDGVKEKAEKHKS